ncbi:MAG: prepilin peptidase [Armatimonadetes bacterium]|nr:prepilin peptidase [Armatimonadota bacterium]
MFDITGQIIIYFFLFIMGACLGSFFNVCIARLPKKESIIFPSSHCPKCNAKIKPLNNIPIISYILLKGKCKNCSARIHWHYFVVELFFPIILILLFNRFGNEFSLAYFKYVILFSFSIIIFFTDLISGIIPDVLSIPLIIIGILFSLFPSSDLHIWGSLIGAGFGFIFFLSISYLFYLVKKREGLGGGDVKFIAAIGSFIGFTGVLFTVLVSSFTAIIFMLLILKYDPKKEFSFGPFMVFGFLIYIIFGEMLTHSYLMLFGLSF